jgi:hypothetical protein
MFGSLFAGWRCLRLFRHSLNRQLPSVFQSSFLRACSKSPRPSCGEEILVPKPCTEISSVTSRSLRRGPTSVSIAAAEQPSAPGQRSSLASHVAQSQLAQPAQSQLARQYRPRCRRRPRLPRRRPLRRHHLHPRHPTSPSSPQLPPAWSPRPSPLSALR